MYIIMVYDVTQNRVSKMMKLCREYLDHIQNSVFEGEITLANFKQLESRINKIIDKQNDSVIIYEVWPNNFKKSILGINKRENSNFI